MSCVRHPWMLLVTAVTVFLLTAAATQAQMNVTVAPASDRPGWAPWTQNSIQPPPEVKTMQLTPTAPQPGDGLTERISRDAIAWFDTALAHVDELVPAAEAAADRIIAGGHLYCTGSPGFVQEMYGRAGGFGFLREWRGETLGSNDVLLVGHLTPTEEVGYNVDFPTLASGGGWNIPGVVVHVSSHQWVKVSRTLPLVQTEKWGGRLFLLDSRAPEGATWSDVSLGQMASVATAWAFQGEMFAAAARKGKTLATLASDLEPNGRRWDRSVEGLNLHPAFKLPSIPPGKIARDYLRICQQQAAEFLSAKEGVRVRTAAKRLSNALGNDRAVFIVVSGHLHVLGGIIPREFPRMVMYGRTWEWRDAVLKPGDILLSMGYLDYPERMVNRALDAGADVVTVSVADGPTDARRAHVGSHWAQWDSVVNVPDYPVRILPTSGVVQTPQWYALMAEALKARMEDTHQPPAKAGP